MPSCGALFAPSGGREQFRCSRITKVVWTLALVSAAGWRYASAAATRPSARPRAMAASRNWNQDAHLLPAAYPKSFQDGGKFQTLNPSLALMTCTDSAEAMRTAQWQVQRDQQIAAPGSVNLSDPPARDTKDSPTDLQNDLGKLQEAEAELSDCLSTRGASASPL